MTNETHTNMFNTITKYELVEKNRLKNCLACNKDLVPNDEKKKLNKYTKTFTSSGYRTDYQFPEGKEFGRAKELPYTGLGTFCGFVRGYLANGIYLDIDIINCHPTILQHEFHRKGLNTEIIDDYIANREEFLIKENITKNDFLIMINKENFVPKSERITKLHNQIYSIH